MANIGALRELRAAVQNQLFYPLKETYSIAYSPKWGNAPSPWQAPEKPVLYIESFASKANSNITINIIKDDITLAKFSYQTKEGFNFIPFDLTFIEDGRVEYEKKLLTTFRSSDNGKYYLPKGTYRMVFQSDTFDQERTLTIE